MSTTPSRPIARDHCLAPERIDSPVYAGRYRRLLEDLPPLEVDEESLHALGRPGGPCDAGIEFVDDADDADARVAAVWPFFGQFVAHDITADRSPVGHRGDPGQIRNFRTPRANLEGVYGAGPVGSPYLYERDDPARLLLGPGGHDVPRNHQGIALVGDPRNDSHLFMNQMQVAFIRLHNALVEQLRDDGADEAAIFDEARRSATWHYQHVILREFLPLLIGDELAADLLDGGARLYEVGDEPYIPFEFADAAYRAGHSQIRQRYQVNPGFGPVPVFPDLMGFGPVPPERAVELEPADRRAGRAAGAALEAHRRPSALLADRPARGHLGRRGGDRLRVAGEPRPAARAGRRPAFGRGRRPGARRRAPRPSRSGSRSTAGRARRRSGCTS